MVFLADLMNRFSDLRHAVRVTARLLRLRKRLYKRVTLRDADVDSNNNSDCISASELIQRFSS